jgi:hypothetical protein
VNGSRPTGTAVNNGHTPSTAVEPPREERSARQAEPATSEQPPETTAQVGSSVDIDDYVWTGTQLLRRSELEQQARENDEKGAETDASESAPPRER